MPTTLKPNLTKPRSFEKCVTVNLGFVARNNKIKNFGMFQQICWEVSGMLPTKALVFGDGYDLEKAKSDPERANILIFKGFVHDKEEIYANLDILVVTSKSEGMPNNVLEALSAGLWVVCYPVGGLIELRHPRLIKVTHYSVKSYADAILDVASNKSSGEAVTKYDTEEMSIKRYISRIQ
jgi:glycosyltransferase involved in cell wall biosynthesis